MSNVIRSVRLVLLVAAMAVVLGAPAPAPGQIKNPADFTFEQGKDSPGKVTFSHDRHKERVEKCVGCHTKVFKMKKGQTGPFTMAKMKGGELCGACHNGKTEVGGKVPFATEDKASCDKCHRK